MFYLVFYVSELWHATARNGDIALLTQPITVVAVDGDKVVMDVQYVSNMLKL